MRLRAKLIEGVLHQIAALCGMHSLSHQSVHVRSTTAYMLHECISSGIMEDKVRHDTSISCLAAQAVSFYLISPFENGLFHSLGHYSPIDTSLTPTRMPGSVKTHTVSVPIQRVMKERSEAIHVCFVRQHLTGPAAKEALQVPSEGTRWMSLAQHPFAASSPCLNQPRIQVLCIHYPRKTS
jgi:hypothetical protein